jgi:APA family basic amino acid/polyamine antiporter
MKSEITAAGTSPPALVRRLGLFDATMIVMGGIIGAGIFKNPSEVAKEVSSPALIMGAWILGGLIALAGSLIYAELAARRPRAGGQYAYLREAYPPQIAFIYGWALLLVTQTGGMAGVAVIFAENFAILTGTRYPDWLVAACTLGVLTAINCLGVKAGSTTQSALMVLKIAAIAALVACGLVFAGKPAGVAVWAGPVLDRPVSFGLLSAVGAALVPVLFAYGGWQTACFIAGEVREPSKNLPRGLIIGVAGVIALYLAVNYVCLTVLGPAELKATETPAAEVMSKALLAADARLITAGARLMAAGIAISTLGFLSQSMLTAPRVYYAMAADGLFFKAVGRIEPRTLVPAVAILLQGVCAAAIAAMGRYQQILTYVVSVDFIFFGLSATCLFALRRRDARQQDAAPVFKVPGHPVTTILFITACWLVVVNTIYLHAAETAIPIAITLAGLPAYFFWRWRNR